MTRDEELRAIDAAIAAGRIRRIPRGATSNWDEMPFRERRRIAMTNAATAHSRKEKHDAPE